tara:strand:+ start:88 stop:606 length:519 start_codon:yes stop_codon:yes gene_type:complete
MKLIMEGWRGYINEIRMPALRGWRKIPLGSVVRLYTESDLFLYEGGAFGRLYFTPLNIVDTGDETGIAYSQAHIKTSDDMDNNDKLYKTNRQGYPKWLEVVVEPDKVDGLIDQYRNLRRQLIPEEAEGYLSIDNVRSGRSHIAFKAQDGDKIPRYHPVDIDVKNLVATLSAT